MIRKLFGAIFILNAILFFFQAMTKSAYGPLIIPFREAFNTDNAGGGLLVTLVFLGYALARFPSGIMADRIGCARTIIWGSAAMSVGFLVISLAESYLALAVFTFLLGVASGIYVTAGYTLAVVIGSRSHAAFATAFFETFGTLAGIMTPLLVAYFVLNHNWRFLFIFAGIMLALATIVFFFAQNKEDDTADDYLRQTLRGNKSIKGRDHKLTENKPANIKEILSDSLMVIREKNIRNFLIWSTLVGGFSAASWMGINAFIPTFFVDEKGFAFDSANQMYALMPISSVFTKLIIGWIADRFGTMRVMLFSLFSGITFYALMQFIHAQWGLILILILIGAFCLNTNTLINSFVLRKMPLKYQGTGFGLFCTAYTVIYSMGPYITGNLERYFGFSPAIMITLTGAAGAFLLVAATMKKYQDNEPLVIS